MSFLTLNNFTSNVINFSAGNSWGMTIIDDELFINRSWQDGTKIYVYDINTKNLLRTLSVTLTMALGTDGINLLASNGNSATANILNIDKNTGETLEIKTNVTFDINASATFKVDLEKDRIYYTDYKNTLYIKKYSDGTLIKSYTLPQSNYLTSVEIIDNTMFLIYYNTNKIYSADLSYGETNLSFKLIYSSSTNIAGCAVYNNKLYLSQYNTSIASMDIYNCLGNKKINIEGMQIGDYIPCRYTALTSGQVGMFSELGTTTVPEIPITGSITPDGLFYFIHTGYDRLGRMKLVADRNIQHSISWDTLNNMGVANGEGLLYNEIFYSIPKMTSASQDGFTINNIGAYLTNEEPWKAFGNGFWGSYSNTSLIITCFKPIKFDYLEIAHAYVDNYCTQFTVSGSNDNSTWEGIKVINNSSWVANVFNKFVLNNTKTYKYYKITKDFLANSSNPARVNFKMYSNTDRFVPVNYNVSMKLLTGGISNIDKDNEWDKIIVENTLNNTIIPGDNSVWNWNNIHSWTSTTPSNSNTTRVLRGHYYPYYYNSHFTSAANTDTGFRPMLLVEQLTTYKYLISQDNKYYSIKPEYYNGNYIPLNVNNLTQDDFNIYGFDSLNELTKEITINEEIFKPVNKFNNFKIYVYKK